MLPPDPLGRLNAITRCCGIGQEGLRAVWPTKTGTYHEVLIDDGIGGFCVATQQSMRGHAMKFEVSEIEGQNCKTNAVGSVFGQFLRIFYYSSLKLTFSPTNLAAGPKPFSIFLELVVLKLY